MTKAIWIRSTMLVLLVGASVASGCGEDDDDDGTPATGGMAGTGGGADGGSGGAGDGGSGTGATGMGGATGGEGGMGAAAGSGGGGGCVELTVVNFSSWCSVSVAGEAAVDDAEQTVCVPPGEIELVATANSGFRLGDAPWHETDGDTGDGEQGDVSGAGVNQSSTAVVTVTGQDCVWVCCEFTNGTGCPTTGQCP